MGTKVTATIPSPSRQRLTAQERRAQIVETAVRMFAERGFRGTTTRELAAAVGVTEPVLYEHFATKRALYDAIIESMTRDGREDLDQLLAPWVETCNDRKLFARLAELLLDWYLDDPRYIRLLLFSALEGHELSDLFFERRIVVWYQVLTDYLGKRMKQRVFRKMDPLLAARAFTGMVAHQGLAAAVFHRGGPEVNRGDIVKTTVDIFLNGLRIPKDKDS